MSAQPHASIHKALGFLRNDRPLRAEEICRDYLAEHPGLPITCACSAMR